MKHIQSIILEKSDIARLKEGAVMSIQLPGDQKIELSMDVKHVAKVENGEDVKFLEGLLKTGPCKIRQIQDELGWSIGKIMYHITKFVKAGTVKVTRNNKGVIYTWK